MLRFAVDELMGDLVFTSIGEGRDLIEMLAEKPDLWDVNLSAWENDSAASRFKRSGYRDGYVSFVNEVTTKPVVGVGRYTSPDAMTTLIKRLMHFVQIVRNFDKMLRKINHDLQNADGV